MGHTHNYAASDHNHDSSYSKLGHTHTKSDIELLPTYTLYRHDILVVGYDQDNNLINVILVIYSTTPKYSKLSEVPLPQDSGSMGYSISVTGIIKLQDEMTPRVAVGLAKSGNNFKIKYLSDSGVMIKSFSKDISLAERVTTTIVHS